MAAAFPHDTPGRKNYAKLCQLIIDGGRSALKTVFDGIHNPANLQTALNTNLAVLHPLQRKRVLKADQWNLLFPVGRAADSSEFDITLLFTLLREICGLHPPASTGRWDDKPPPSDTSRAANLARIKWFRNKLAHKATAEFDETTFNDWWAELSSALVQLGLDQSEVEQLKRSSLGDEDKYIKLLKDWEEEKFGILGDKLDLIDGKLEDLQSKWNQRSEGILLGDFRCFEDEKHLIAKGSKGNRVYEGTLVSSGEKIAVKRMVIDVFDMKEANLLKTMDHPNIIKCFAVESQGPYMYLALEYGKKTLRACVGDNDFDRESSGIKRLQFLKDVTAAVEYLHDRNICHRDIKPDNILLSVSEPARFILADFNTAKRSSPSESASTHLGSFVGTVGYGAPEMIDPTTTITVQSDIFPLGCVFYYTLTGKCHPFGSVRELGKCQKCINRGQPPVLKETDFLEHSWAKPLIAAMIRFDHHQRPSAADVLDCLEKQQGLGAGAPSGTTLEIIAEERNSPTGVGEGALPMENDPERHTKRGRKNDSQKWKLRLKSLPFFKKTEKKKAARREEKYVPINEDSTTTVRDDLNKIKGWALEASKSGLQELEVNARRKGYQLRHDNPEGGNCMFNALLDQLRRLGGREMEGPQMVREKLVDYLERNSTLDDGTKLFDFVSGHPSWSDYLDGMRRDGTWGDHLILLAAANLLERPIVVITSLPHNEEIVMKPSTVSVGQVGGDPMVLGHVAELHYISLEPLPEDGMPKKPEVKIPATVEQKKGSSGEEPATDRSMDVDAKGWTVFHHTCAKGNVRLIKRQLQNGVDINHRTNAGETPLSLAARGGHIEAVRLLFSEGADLHALNEHDQNALHDACISGDVPTIEFLLKKGFELESVDKKRVTPLLRASSNGRLNTVEFLVQKGADLHARNEHGQNALHEACLSGDVPTIEFLLNKGFELESVDNYRVTPLLHAAFKGRLNAVEFLVQKGADLHALDQYGLNALHEACISGDVPTIEFLLKKGFELESVDNDGMTPLLRAAFRGRLNAAEFLLQKGANLHAKSPGGWTAAHLAAYSGDVATLKFLKAKGCNMNQKTDNGKTPVMIALEYEKDEAAEYLLSLTGV